MSDLSFLIETQNEVLIDQSYLQKCQQNTKQNDMKKSNSGFDKLLTSKEIKFNKTKTQLGTKGKTTLQKSFKNLFSTQQHNQPSKCKSAETAVSDKEELTKITMRIEALQENQKRLQQKIGIQFFQIREEIQKKSRQQNQQVQEVKRIKTDLNDTKRKIGELLSMITSKNK